MRIIVCGGRNHCDRRLVERELTRLHWRMPISVVIHGGGDAQAIAIEHWARMRGLAVVRYRPNWERFGHRGEILRNAFMLEDTRPDLVVAFPGGHSTADLVQRARNSGIAVLEIRLAPEADCRIAELLMITMVSTGNHHRTAKLFPPISCRVALADRTRTGR
ncbi:Protein of unknown function [Rhizobiales bacterium GAS113]|nr:Protein of unknown function [Rhizobiales bacterium GAS113]